MRLAARGSDARRNIRGSDADAFAPEIKDPVEALRVYQNKGTITTRIISGKPSGDQQLKTAGEGEKKIPRVADSGWG